MRKTFPAKVDAFSEHGFGNVLYAFHQVDKKAFRAGAHGRETHAAIAEHRGGHAVPRRRREVRIPQRLAIVVRVYVDPARREQQAVGVDFAFALAEVFSHFRKFSVIDRDIGDALWRAGAVN